MGSRYARNLYDPKIKRIFEIARAHFEKILFIHFYPLKKALGRSQRHFLKKIMMDYCLPLQMNTFGPKKFWFSCTGKKVPFWQFFIQAGMALFDLCMQIKNFLVQMYSFEVVNNSPSYNFSESASGSVQVLF